ncbi:MAG: HAD family hydrolase, partial [Methylophilaceae bacterium]
AWGLNLTVANASATILWLTVLIYSLFNLRHHVHSLQAFGIPNLIGTDPEQIDGQFTGKVAGLPSFQEGKVTRLYDWLSARGQALADFEKVYFYSDSHNDLPLLRLVNHPVAVNPDPILQAEAEQKAWPIMSLRD